MQNSDNALNQYKQFTIPSTNQVSTTSKSPLSSKDLLLADLFQNTRSLAKQHQRLLKSVERQYQPLKPRITLPTLNTTQSETIEQPSVQFSENNVYEAFTNQLEPNYSLYAPLPVKKFQMITRVSQKHMAREPSRKGSHVLRKKERSFMQLSKGNYNQSEIEPQETQKTSILHVEDIFSSKQGIHHLDRKIFRPEMQLPSIRTSTNLGTYNKSVHLGKRLSEKPRTKVRQKPKQVIMPGEELEVNLPIRYRISGEDRMWRYKSKNIGNGSVFDLEKVSEKFLKSAI